MKIVLQTLAVFIVVILFQPHITKAETPLWIGQIDGTLLAPVGEPILTEAYKRIGKDITFIPAPSKRSLGALNAGKLDGEMLRTERVAQIYPDIIKIDVPIFINGTYALTYHKDASIKNMEDLSKYKIGIIKGLLSIEKRTEHLHPRPFASYEAAFKLLAQKKIDIIIAPLFHAAASIHKARHKNTVHILKPALHSTPLYHFVSQKNVDLVPDLTKALQKMKEDGTIKSIVTKAFQKNGITPPDDIF